MTKFHHPKGAAYCNKLSKKQHYFLENSTTVKVTIVIIPSIKISIIYVLFSYDFHKKLQLSKFKKNRYYRYYQNMPVTVEACRVSP